MSRRAMPHAVRLNLAQGLADSVVTCWPDATPDDLGAIAAAFVERLAERSADPARVLLDTVEPLKGAIRAGFDLHHPHDSAAPVCPHSRPAEPAGAG